MEMLVRAFRVRVHFRRLEGNHEDILNHYDYQTGLGSPVRRHRIRAPAHRPERHLDSGARTEQFCRPARH